MRLALLGSLLLLAGCSTGSRPAAPEAPAPAEAAVPAPAPQEELSQDLLRRYLTYLASDELEGRCAGFPGNDKAAEFIAERFREGGLVPVGDPGPDGRLTYFQHFKIRRGELTTRNCAGFLKGSELPDEVVILGAHHDHVGRKGQFRAGQIGDSAKEDDIWNGADDNGSGTTILLGVVRHFAVTRPRPRRSILFLTFSAEEWGLLGSRHYVNHPLFPLDQTVTMINMDQVGRTSEENVARAYALASCADRLFHDIMQRAGESAGMKFILDDTVTETSDHFSFFQKGLPVLGIKERGPCPDYHRTSDHVEKISFGTIERVARAVSTALLEIANRPERPKRNPNYKRPRPPESVTPRLGVNLDSLEGEGLQKLGLGKDRGALYITGVSEDSVALAHGLKEGDVIVSFGGEAFPADNPRESLIQGLGRVIRGEPVVLEIVRGSERKSLNLVWPATAGDTKVKDLIARLPEKGDPADEKEIAELGEVAEARARRLAGEIGRRVRTGIAIRRRAEGVAQAWGKRVYRHLDREGREIGSLRIAVNRAKEGGVDAIKLECEETMNGRTVSQVIVCALDSRLSLVRLSRTADGKTRELSFDPTVPSPNRTASAALMFIAGTLPEEFRGLSAHGEEGREDESASLALAGPGECEVNGKKVAATRIIQKGMDGGDRNAWVNASGVVLLVEGPQGRLELAPKGPDSDESPK